MTRAYDTRPDLEGYDALTVSGIAKFAGILVLLFGAQFLADRFGLGRWLRAGILAAQVLVGLKVMWIGIRALASGQELPNASGSPRYADREINFVSPRTAAAGEIIAGAVMVGDALYKFSLILSE